LKLCRYLVVVSLFLAILAPESATAARARKAPLPAVTQEGAYQNKPIQPGATVWYCFTRRADIVCLLGDAGNQELRPMQVVDARLPGIVGEILNRPEELADGPIRIPLHTEPFDFQLVGQLADAVMCGSNRSCGVIFAETFGELQALVANFERTRQDPRPFRIVDRTQSATYYD
jgi:hypothetical protein